MPSRFRKKSTQLVNPSICRKQILPPFIQPEEFKDWFLQAYVYWYSPGTPLEINFPGQMLLQPDPPANTWSGLLVGDNYTIELEVERTVLPDTFAFWTAIVLGGPPISPRVLGPLNFTADEHFDTHLLTFPPPASGGKIEARVTA